MAHKSIANIIETQDIARIRGDTTIREVGRYMVDHHVGSVLVMEGEALKGIFTERDALNIFVATRRNPDLTKVADVMTDHPQTISMEASREEAIRMMVDGGFRHIPVVDGEGKVVGVISQRDLLMDDG